MLDRDWCRVIICRIVRLLHLGWGGRGCGEVTKLRGMWLCLSDFDSGFEGFERSVLMIPIPICLYWVLTGCLEGVAVFTCELIMM